MYSWFASSGNGQKMAQYSLGEVSGMVSLSSPHLILLYIFLHFTDSLQLGSALRSTCPRLLPAYVPPWGPPLRFLGQWMQLFQSPAGSQLWWNVGIPLLKYLEIPNSLSFYCILAASIRNAEYMELELLAREPQSLKSMELASSKPRIS